MRNWKVRKNLSLLLYVATLLIGLLALSPCSAISQLPASGTLDHSDLFGGPATVTMRQVLINPNTISGWHYHSGVGAYTVVKQGTITIEDGCGVETSYSAGQAFLEPPNRVHRGKNLGASLVETIQALIVPFGTPISVGLPQGMCGEPLKANECKNNGWSTFNFPRTFENQGDCEQFVQTGKSGE